MLTRNYKVKLFLWLSIILYNMWPRWCRVKYPLRCLEIMWHLDELQKILEEVGISFQNIWPALPAVCGRINLHSITALPDGGNRHRNPTVIMMPTLLSPAAPPVLPVTTKLASWQISDGGNRHWNPIEVMMPTLLPLAALEDVDKTTSGAASDKKLASWQTSSFITFNSSSSKLFGKLIAT